MTNESVVVTHEGKSYTVREGMANYKNLCKALRDKEWEKVPGYLTIATTITQWSNDKFKIHETGEVTYNDSTLPRSFGARIAKMAADGEDPTPLFKFHERLLRNPSKRSVDQLWPFLEKVGIPLTKDGCFLAYKGVGSDYMDHHSGTICNKPGTLVKLPRNSISDDPREACHFGLHVGNDRYARSFAGNGKLMVCKVNPEHVVCVPYDSSQEKMRVCEYYVIGVHGSELPDTVYGGDEADEKPDAPGTETTVTKARMKSSKGEKKKPAATVIHKKKPQNNDFSSYKNLDVTKLMELSLDELRKYATYGLEIVGASKIPGGKTMLIKKILKARVD